MVRVLSINNDKVNLKSSDSITVLIKLKNLVKNSNPDGAAGSPGVRVQDHVTMELEQD